MGKATVSINATNEFSKTFTELNGGLDTALTKVANLKTGFEDVAEAAKKMYNIGKPDSQGNGVGDGSNSNGRTEFEKVLTAGNSISDVGNRYDVASLGTTFARPIVSGVEKVTAHGAETADTMNRTTMLGGGGQAQLELQQKAEHNTALFALDQEHKRKTLELDKVTWDMKFKTASSATSTMGNLMQNLYVATGSKNKAMFEAGKGFAIAETVINTYAAAMGAYKSQASIPIIGPALGVAAAGAALAAGAAQVREITSTHPGGGSISSRGIANPPYAGGSPSALPVPMRLAEKDEKLFQHITVNIHTLEGTDVNWEKIAEDNIKPALEALKDRNVRLDILTT